MKKLFYKFNRKIEDLIFYLACKEAHEKGDWVSNEELFQTLQERV